MLQGVDLYTYNLQSYFSSVLSTLPIMVKKQKKKMYVIFQILNQI